MTRQISVRFHLAAYGALQGLLCFAGLSGGAATAQTFGCTPAMANEIVCENSKTGNPKTEWDVTGAGNSTIQGFTTDISVNRGQTVRFKVNTTASAYRLDIYRMGFYNGAGARKVATVNPSAALPQTQPNCLTQPATGLVDCGNWSESASWAIPANAASGIYFAKLVRTDNGGASHVFFIVRSDGSNSALVFQTTDTTWVSYNTYGGNSLYTGAPAGRAYKVSYNRPINTRAVNSGQSWIFNSEYPMVRWLESNGYDVSYVSGIDTDRFGSSLLGHRVFVSVGHDEYWSGAQRTNVEAARAAGVHLAFFSGNEVFWKIRWENSIDSSAASYRTMVCYKETQAGAPIDPQNPPIWTGTWRDPRFSPPGDGGRPENALTGTIFRVNGPRNDAITVPGAFRNLRLWRNTTVATLPAGGLATFPLGTLGYEWDEDADNGFRPAGLIQLSSTSLDVSGYYLLDYGSNYGGGVATHSLTLYKAPSGALVFGAGTTQWSWGLDSNHDNGNAAPDVRMQQATVNLFADMGVQPASLRPGLVAATQSTDTIPPTTVLTTPAAGASLPVGDAVIISGTATDTGGGVVGGIEVSVDGGSRWYRATGTSTWSFTWTPATLGAYTLMSRATDDSANIGPVSSRSVTVVANTTPPTISTVQTAALASTWATITWTTSRVADTQVEYGPTTAYGSSTTLDPALVLTHAATIPGLMPGATYNYRVKSRDAYGNLAISGNFTFTTSSTDSTVTIHFNDRVAQHDLSGQYPTGIIDWGNGSWWVSQPWGAFTTNSISFFSANIFSGSFSFLTPLRLVRLDAYNGGAANSTVTISCGGLTTQATLAASQKLTIATGWTNACSPVLVSSTNGYDTNFDDLVVDAPSTTPPVISNIQATQTTCGSTTITWTTNIPSDSQVDYGTTTSYGSSTTLDPALVTSHSVTIVGLASSTLYNFRVKSKSNINNLAVSGNSTFSTTPPDGIPPVISAIKPEAVSNTSAFIAWTTNEGANSQVEYGPTAGYGLSTTIDPALLLTRSVGLSGLTPGTLYNFRVKSMDACGTLAVSQNFTFATSTVPPATIWSASAVPAVPAQADPAAVELGVKFRADVNGYVTGIRFYKGTGNTGTHTGKLWDSAGTLLASAVFTNETTTGWQTVTFSRPAFVSANTVYIASYHAPVGRYAVDNGYFGNTGVDNGQLHALRNGVSGPNGVFLYGAGGFPTFSYESSNYWVDILFVPDAVTVPPVISAVQAGQTTCGGTVITWTTDIASDSQVEYGTTTALGSTTTLDPALVTSHSVTLNGLLANTTYYYRVRSKSTAINLSISPLSSFTTGASDGVPPLFSAVTPVAVSNTTASITWATNELATSQVEYGTTPAYGSLTAVSTTLAMAHNVPLTGLSPNTLYYFRVRGVDACGAAGVSQGFQFTTGGAAPASIWSAAATPAIPAQSDAGAIELGVRFRSDINGYVTGIRFYKGTGNTGTHTGKLWSAAGALLASAVFTNETATGWQQVSFSNPVAITANSVYIASYHAPAGRYSVDVGYFLSTGVDNGVLHALRDGVSGANGVFLYGPGGFPANTYESSNYWVDITFVPAYDAVPPVISQVQANVSSCSGVIITWTSDKASDSQVEFGTTPSFGSSTTLDPALLLNHSVSLSGLLPNTTYYYRVKSKSSPINTAVSPTYVFTTGAGDGLPPTFSLVSAIAVSNTSAYIRWTTNKASSTQVDYGTSTGYGSSTTLDPALVTLHTALLTGLTANTGYNYRLRSTDACGIAGISGNFTFTTAAAPPNTIWPATATPAVDSQFDTSPIELGVKFRSTQTGYITGVRFYKGAANTGPHTGKLYDSNGVLLASAPFVNETASGWQQVTFPVPVAITANTVYVASYHTTVGRYAVDQSYFALNGVTNGPLQALQSGVSGPNGVYMYGAGAFPTNSYESSNYWVDVVFVP